MLPTSALETPNSIHVENTHAVIQQVLPLHLPSYAQYIEFRCPVSPYPLVAIV